MGDRINGSGTILNGAGHRIFQNANLAAGISGTELDAGYFTDNQEDVIGAISAAGLTPTAGAVQLPSAISKLAVLAAAGNYQGVTVISTPATMTAAEAGQFVEMTSPGEITLNLPSPIAFGAAGFLVWNNSTVANSVACPAGTFLGPGGSSAASFTLAPGQLARFVSDSSNWIVVSLTHLPTGLPFFQDVPSLSTTTTNNATYTLVTREITFPANSPTNGFRLKGHGILNGASTAKMQQNFQLSLYDGSVTINGPNTLCYVDAAAVNIGVEATFYMPGLYTPGQAVNFSLAVNTAGGGGYTGQMAMSGAQLDLQVSYS